MRSDLLSLRPLHITDPLCISKIDMSNLIGNDYKERWYPIRVSTLHNHLFNANRSIDASHELNDVVSNVCYNLQYLEYLDKTLRDLNLSKVLIIQTIKSFIVISVSIIEAYLYIICRANNVIKTNNWEEMKTLSNSQMKIDKELYKFESKLYKRNDDLSPINPTLDQLLQLVQKKKLININLQFFKDMSHLRKLRNTIHLQVSEKKETDYKTFWKPEFNLARNNLRLLLINDIFKGDNYKPEIFDFLTKE